jgi:hypothetical protein
MSTSKASLARGLELPRDLREWIDDRRLVQFVYEAVEEANKHLPAGQARVLLTVLTYSYALGVYSSDEIQDRVTTDSQLQYLSANVTPSSSELRQFRRHHKEVLQRCLSVLLELVWGERAQFAWRRFDGKAAFTGAAKDRIEQAVLVDTISLDY